jgi:hypothetical protein
LPYSDYAPAGCQELCFFGPIASGIGVEFGPPEYFARSWNRGEPTPVGVPEATVDEYRRFEFRENDVGRTGEMAGMKTKAEPKAVQGFSQKEFRAGVSRANAGHDA